jgi:hypothetical protein
MAEFVPALSQEVTDRYRAIPLPVRCKHFFHLGTQATVFGERTPSSNWNAERLWMLHSVLFDLT